MRASQQQQLQVAILRLNIRVLGFAFGFLAGGGLFVAKHWLVLKGGPNVGAHLILLRNYFPGYSVTFGGSLIGFAYAFVVGFAIGACMAYFYNRLVRS